MNVHWKIKNLLENRTIRIAATVSVAIIAVALSIWIFTKYWPVFLLAGAGFAAFYTYRHLHAGINIAAGVTVTSEALASYLHETISGLKWDIKPEINVNGWGEKCAIKIRVDLPAETSKAAEFHSQVIYLKGYIARRLKDDFRIQNAKVEIEAVLPPVIIASS